MRYELQYGDAGEGYFLSREAAHEHARALSRTRGYPLDRFRVVPIGHGRLNLANRPSKPSKTGKRRGGSTRSRDRAFVAHPTAAEAEDVRVYGDPAVPFLAQHWYAGQGDPLYALASSGWPQPLSTVEWAHTNALRSRTDFDAAMRRKYGKRRRWSSEDLDADDELRQLEEGLHESVRRRAREEWY